MAEEKTTERSEFDIELEETPAEETPVAPKNEKKEKKAKKEKREILTQK